LEQLTGATAEACIPESVIEIAPKDIEKQSLCVVRRFVLSAPGETEQQLRQRKKQFFPCAEALERIAELLSEMQRDLLENARRLCEQKSRVIDSLEEFEAAALRVRGRRSGSVARRCERPGCGRERAASARWR
jgi:hypothetical protein